MRLFINDVPTIFVDSFKGDKSTIYNSIDKAIEKGERSPVFEVKSSSELVKLVSQLHHSYNLNVHQVTIVYVKIGEIKLKKILKKQFRLVKAGGGIVVKGNQFLMIYRLGKWDLPKGKLEEGENFRLGAYREVQEECNVGIEVGKKITDTFHTFTSKKGNAILKQTRWYEMNLLSDANMSPQREEGIERIRWVKKNEISKVLQKSYRSIEYLLDQFFTSVTHKE